MTSFNRKRVALIMPIRNDAASVRPTMDAIYASTRMPDEIVVADGLSTDGTLELIKEYEGRGITITVVANPRLWAGGGRNAAVRATNCDILVLNDFGNIIEPDYIEKIVKPFESDEQIELVSGLFQMRVTSDFEHCVAAIHYYDNYVLERLNSDEVRRLLPEIILPGGLCTAVTRRMWLAAGGQPEWLAKGQDKLFSRKVYALGGKSVVAPDARLWHHVRSNLGDLFRQVFFYGRGNGQMRFISRHVVRLMMVYGSVSALLLLGFVSTAFPVLAALAFLAYIWRAGARKVLLIDGRLKKLRYIPMAGLVLVTRDIGSLLGHLLGWAEWVARPKFRDLYYLYMRELPPERISVLAPDSAGPGMVGKMLRAMKVS
ncbi:glycosyltransferase [Microvirga guangxiensis]|uniref:Glycosyltransferase, catalytic subunit of cellulose synthase and poly-beta-1,6-N-acetylglucosamine synthase n=1 Tax=Microvirga guangxiensis TaxID=549386 RepID=A0A1G5H0D4_9HYPH|nr:glycosyltransferase [Microvirga guangxiensis]SCY57141.1 Glycosyltransferase, catalytic subunit of cellulose synthase and poly-beta-1,6-N-acetylglucosamine synthase [Microvirga guangxiensis]